MQLKQLKHLTNFANTLDAEYRTSTVYFIIHTAMPLQFKLYSLKFTNKLLSSAILPFLKITPQSNSRSIYSSSPNCRQEISLCNLAEKLFLKNGVS